MEGEWKTDEILRSVIKEAHRPNKKVIFDSDPKALVERLVEMAFKDKEVTNLVFNTPDKWDVTGKNAEYIL